MPNRTPAQARVAIDQQLFLNSAQERAARMELERLIAEVTTPIARGADKNMRALNEEAGELAVAATQHVDSVGNLLARMRRREMTTKEARQERDKLRREEMRLSQLLVSITKTYESELYVRDHPEDVLNVLYDRYPTLLPPHFPI
ncbi:hypothetical protein [Modestobacter sp. SYSU DS0290]